MAKLLNLDVFSENILGVKQYELGKAQEDREYGRMLQVLKNAMHGELTKRQYDCVYAYFFEDKTQVKIAQEFGLSVSTVNRHLQKAKARLSKILQYCFARLR